MNLELILLALLVLTGGILGYRYYFTHKSDIDAPLATANEFDLAEDLSWDTIAKKRQIDPALRRIVSLIQITKPDEKGRQGWVEVYRRTGLKHPRIGGPNKAQLELALLFEFDPNLLPAGQHVPAIPHVTIPKAYKNEIRDRQNGLLTHVTGTLMLTANRIFQNNDPAEIRDMVAGLDSRPNLAVTRVSLASPLQPSFEESLSDIGLPSDNSIPRNYQKNGQNFPLKGRNIVVGIIDDGCSFAHPEFRNGNGTRVQFLWHQDDSQLGGAWTRPSDFPYGAEIDKARIDNAISTAATKGNGVPGAYAELAYDMPLATHGTHVMGIAAANAGPLSEGVACEADIIFVQLPVASIESGGAVLYNHILDGVLYIFARARSLGKPAVVNISYGGYAGPHDGSSELEKGIDELLTTVNATDRVSRCVVVAAGNGFEADCHAMGTLDDTHRILELQWNIKPEDPTSNTMEIWYTGDASITATITPPNSSQLAAVPFGKMHHVYRNKTTSPQTQTFIGSIDHLGYAGNTTNLIGTARELKRIMLVLGPTEQPEDANALSTSSGIWKVTLTKVDAGQTTSADFHAWIERDASGGRGSARRQQSHFMPEKPGTAGIATPVPSFTLGSIATGQNTIAVGAYNSATKELSRYSACGPTRDNRAKPEICAPAEGDPGGRGILSTSSLSAAPSRMNGTSASAPHVAGAVALIYDYIGQRNTINQPTPPLSAVEIRQKLMDGATRFPAGPMPPAPYNSHQQVDEKRQGRRQSDMTMRDLTGDGKLNIRGALDQVP